MPFSVPDKWPDGSLIESGQLILIVATTDFSEQASTVFNVVEPKPTVAIEPYTNVSPASDGAGTQVTVTGGGFPAATQVNVHLAQLVRASGIVEDPAIYQSTTTDANGNFSITFVMPNTWPDNSFIGTGKLAIVVATADFTKQAAATFRLLWRSLQSDDQGRAINGQSRHGCNNHRCWFPCQSNTQSTFGDV